MTTERLRTAACALFAGAAMTFTLIGAAAAQGGPQNLRGEIKAVSGDEITLAERGGQTIKLMMNEKSRVGTLVAAKLEDIKQGDFVGVAAEPMPDGKLKAQEVTIFPKGVRVGEGHQPWDLSPKSTMTNADVDGLVASASGRELKLKYKDGEKTVVVPPSTPIVTPGAPDKSLLKPGVKIYAVGMKQPDGSYQAVRISVGKDGLAPPM